MIAITDSLRPRTKEQETELFVQFIPAIKRHARIAFRHLRSQERTEAVSEVVANAFNAFRRLAERGKLEVAYASPLARFAVTQVRAGRRVGNKPNVHDVFSFLVQRQQGYSFENLYAIGPDGWCEALVDNTSTPVADAAAFRLDFLAWLQNLHRRERELVTFLSLGNTPTEAAQQFRISRARVSQLRKELEASWQTFQDEDPKPATRSQAVPPGPATIVA